MVQSPCHAAADMIDHHQPMSLAPLPPSSLVPLDFAALEQVVRDAEPGALLLPMWLLRKYIEADRETGAAPLSLPHGQIHVIRRERLLEVAWREDLPPGPELPSASTLILLCRPESDWLEETPASQVLRHYWRLLFHGRLDLEMQRRLGIGHAAGEGSSVPNIRGHIQQLGSLEFNEARFVLQQENQLLPGADDAQAWAEFAATYLEWRHFSPKLLGSFFPSLEKREDVEAILARDVDAADLLERTHLAGAADAEPAAATMPAALPEVESSDAQTSETIPEGAADRARAAGNVVRAAILHMRGFASRRQAGGYARALRDLEELVRRLGAALELEEGSYAAWLDALSPLLPRAARIWWNPEGRLLYDLQKLCLDHEREIYSVGVVEWLVDRCRRPLVRAQPFQRLVQACKHLRMAISHLAAVHVGTGGQNVLAQLLHAALGVAERRLRQRLRQPLIESLEAGGLQPHNAVEQVAQEKLIEELLDILVERGFLSFSMLRDAISRNQLKFYDLSGPASTENP